MNEAKTPEELETEEYDRQLRMLSDLSNSEAFQTWRDMVVTPIITQLEIELSSVEADTMPEAILRGKLKQLNSLKHIFFSVFEIAKMNIKNNK